MSSKTWLRSLSVENTRESLDRFATRPAFVVGAIAAVALLVRLFGLGARMAHQDEGRVAYWTLRYVETGVWNYRPIVHGPFLLRVNSVIFDLFGANDFTARLVVAVVGGLLPLSALLFREHLRNSEIVGVALFLAANPLLLYYSRFMRNDLLLAGFMLVSFGLFVRAYDTRLTRYLYAGTAVFALAFTTKENALVYPVAWAGATVLLLDHRLFLARNGREDWVSVFVSYARRTASGIRNWLVPFALSVAEFFAIFVFFYAPRRRGVEGPGLWKAVGDPGMFPAVVEEATLGSWNEFVDQWGGGNQESYLSALKPLVDVLEVAAIPLLALALVGFVVDRYAGERPRDVVAFAFYWGFASVLGYPLVVDNPFPWETVHMIVPFVIPAGVGLALVFRRGRNAISTDDGITAAAAVVLLLIVSGQVAMTAVGTSYQHPQDPDNGLVQYAQPSGQMKPTLATVERIVRTNEGTDVMFYGYIRTEDDGGRDYELYSPNEGEHVARAGRNAGAGWFDRLPLSWYLESYGANVTSTNRASDLEGNAPPVVIAFGPERGVEKDSTDIRPYLDGYVKKGPYQLYLWGQPIVFFVDESALPAGSNRTNSS